MDDQYLIEKFTRCPACGSFSLHGIDDEGKCFECSNCGEEFLLKDDQLKTANGSKKSKILKSESKPKPEPEPELKPKPEPEYREESRQFEEVYSNRFDETPAPPRRSSSRAILLAVPLLIAAAVAVFFILPGSETPPPVERQQPVSAMMMEEKKEPAKQPETAKEPVNPPEAVPSDNASSETSIQPSTSSSPNTELTAGNKTETQPNTETVTPTTVTEEEPDKQPPPEKVEEDNGEPWYRYIFKPTLVKIRSRHPNSSHPRNRWYFKRFKLTVKRTDSQRVLIAGDASGTKKWAVDDMIIVNGKRIEGCREKMTSIGNIPVSKQIPPFDITDMVEPNRDVQLNLKLADYGEFWGNTAIYIVIK